MKLNKQVLKNVLLLGACLLIGGLYCFIKGQDATWDLLNYHLYTPFAFLHNRYGQDLFVAGVHSTMNPLLDVPYYLLFRALFHHPALLGFVYGFVYGLCLWLMYKVAEQVFENRGWWWRICVVVLAATAAGTLLQASLVTGEMANLVILLTSIWCFVFFVKNPEKVKFLYWASFLAGCAAGCKLTAGYYCIALFAATIPNLRYAKRPAKAMFLFCLLGAAGFLLTDGYFMWKWYNMYGNPIFPYYNQNYNQIFKSPYFNPVYLTEEQFFPHSIGQWLFYPFYWAWSSDWLVVESPLADKRMALGYIAVIILTYRLLAPRSLPINRRLVSSLLILTVVSYMGWLLKFCIIRYACAIEFLACLLIFIVLDCITKKAVKIVVALLLMSACIFHSDVPTWHHEDFGIQEVVEFSQKPEIEDNALVFLMYLPTSYLVPLLNPKASYMGGFISRPQEYPEEYRKDAFLHNNILRQYYQYHIEDLQREKIAKHEGPIYIISIDWPMIRNEKTLARFGLKPTAQPCTSFTNNWIYDFRWDGQNAAGRFAICPVEKIVENDKK